MVMNILLFLFFIFIKYNGFFVLLLICDVFILKFFFVLFMMVYIRYCDMVFIIGLFMDFFVLFMGLFIMCRIKLIVFFLKGDVGRIYVKIFLIEFGIVIGFVYLNFGYIFL